MAVAELLAPQPGERVLDLAAAPGGKTTHLAALMGDEGLLVANDIDGRRARILAENLERWGVKNSLVTNAHPDQLVQRLGAVFDRVLVDAPCSGEGMFRRLGAFEWSEEMVTACARRQTAVLDSAARLVKPGGRLVYATCTFSPEEDEAIVAKFLQTRPDFKLVEPARFTGFSQGQSDWVAPELQNEELAKTVRLWPQSFNGEGHFMALMQNEANKKPEGLAKPFGFKSLPASELSIWREFAALNLKMALVEERLLLHNGRLYLLPEQAIDTTGLKLVRYGLLLGEVRKGYFKPDQALALALRLDEVVTAVDLPPTSPLLTAYLSGHPLPLNQIQLPITNYQFPTSADWALICTAGFPLGWAKVSGSQLKNHYPHQLRRQYGHEGS